MPAGDRGSTDGELAGLIGATQSLVRQLSRNSSGLGLGSQPRAEQQQQQQQPVLTRLQSQTSGGWLEPEAAADRLQRGLSSEVGCPVTLCRQVLVDGIFPLHCVSWRASGPAIFKWGAGWHRIWGAADTALCPCRVELDAGLWGQVWGLHGRLPG